LIVFQAGEHIDRLLGFLNGVRQDGAGWKAKCPSHDDARASLSVSVGDNGAAILHCHAGCTTKAVLLAMKLSMADLYPEEKRQARSRKPQATVVAEYDYFDLNGELLYQTVRYEPKGFRQRKPNNRGGWTWKLSGVPRVLYRLPDLLAADPAAPVFVCEGEKDADRLCSLGLVATSNVGGAGKWLDSYSESIEGRHVLILPDNDQAGMDHALKVATSCASRAASIRIVTLPGLPPKGDVCDWLDAGGNAGKLLELSRSAAKFELSGDDGSNHDTPQTTAIQPVQIVQCVQDRPCQCKKTDVTCEKAFVLEEEEASLREGVRNIIDRMAARGPGEIGRQMFDLARELLNIDCLKGADPYIDLWELVAQWRERSLPHVTAPLEECLDEFCRAWGTVKFPAGQGPLELAFRIAKADPLPAAALGPVGNKLDPNLHVLAAACRELQRINAVLGNDCFVLGANDAARHLGISDSKKAWRWLNILQRARLIKLVEVGSTNRSDRKASAYRWLGPVP
jgi:hypothetical protein